MAIRPPILRAGDTIGVVTLGSPRDEATINERIQFLENLGFSVLVGDYVYSSEGYLAATPQQRASDLMSMFENPNIRAIIPVRGGTGVKDVIPYLDYNLINRNPKIFTGYSDITVLLNVLYIWSNLITFHSLLLIDFRSTTPAYNFNQFFTATSTLTSPRLMENPPGIPLVSRVPGNVSGTIVGGNLQSFVDTLGTPYEVDTKGRIVFIEETHESISRVYRLVTHLIHAGKFRDCAGIIVGECTNCPDAYGKTYEDLINDVLVPLGKPLMTNLASGHGYYKMTIPIGAHANLNTFENTLIITEPTVSLT
ncbi:MULTISPECIES: S66 peptidase family protein [unclassified Sedimentibacter]|uniref:S66 peptidase family protein n=1 Tax=unclassified Sedimentibacter TaxID=2649220 RepID=UPI0027DF90BF|nr:LD-carboxypeptidase [Sedimentibacter sp. MB35-C1]WMJ76830.1 LD-carboxypeptidase [Sedimentibacter sp. MB35-C1]